jgi:nucleoside-diphosphate-sugar epimerase
MRFTILGAGGYIGCALVAALEEQGHECVPIARHGRVASSDDHGHVIFCVGLTADFRSRPLDAVEAHVSAVVEFLRTARFETFLYLSSTRIYRGGPLTGEDDPIAVMPRDPEQLYNLSKLAGEATCFSVEDPRVRVARLSSVYGGGMASPSFLATVIADAVAGHVELWTALDSEKDYVHINDVCTLLPRIALEGAERLYNVAAGVNVSNREIVEILRRETGCSVTVAEGAVSVRDPRIDIARVRDEFGLVPRRLERHLAALVNDQALRSARA